MSTVASYFLSLTAGAMIAVLVGNMLKDGLIKQILRILCGLLLLIVMLRPIKGFRPESIQGALQELTGQEEYRQEYEALYQQRLREHISSTAEAFIAQKGEELGVFLTVRVELTDETYPVPYKAEIRGAVDLQKLEEMKAYIADNIGIPKENQRWIIYG